MTTDDELLASLSRRLAEAHAQVAGVADEEVRTKLSRRLIAVTNAAKHDLPTASRRLDALLREVREVRERTENPGS